MTTPADPLPTAQPENTMSTNRIYTPAELRYAATARCPCGAGFAYPLDAGIHGEWTCSAILTGTAADVQHDGPLPFAFYEIKSEDQPSARGRTTRPTEDDAAKHARAIEVERDVIRRADSLASHFDEQQRKLDADRADWADRRAKAVARLVELGASHV